MLPLNTIPAGFLNIINNYMKIYELFENQTQNPIGQPPSNIEEINKFFSQLERQFVSSIYDGKSISGQQYIKALADMDELGKIEKIPIDKLIPMEPTVDTNHINSLISGVDVKTSGKGIKIYKYDNQYYIVDGNHRAAVEKIKNKKNIQALVIDVNKIQNIIQSMSQD